MGSSSGAPSSELLVLRCIFEFAVPLAGLCACRCCPGQPTFARPSGLCSAVSCGVTHIDELPPECRGCCVVYLSSNSLRSLEGVGQFVGLRVLSVASNLLERTDELAALQACEHLEVRGGAGSCGAGSARSAPPPAL